VRGAVDRLRLIGRGIDPSALAVAGVGGRRDVLDADDAIAPGQDWHAGNYSDSGTDERKPARREHRLIY
jgi:hypothetical protein